MIPDLCSVLFQTNISLRQYNTFGIEARAERFAPFRTIAELESLLEAASGPLLILGGGSNVLLTRDWAGTVLRNELEGVEEAVGPSGEVLLRAGGGVNWHSLVLHSLQLGLSGMENLALIPGSTGASPMQNIGAYGVEIKDIFHSLEAWDREDRKMVTFTNPECGFGYRESVFKRQYRGRFIILSVTFRLSRGGAVNTSYGAIRAELERMGVEAPTPGTVAVAVIRIRSSKLPDPKEVGNAGSFFKNPVIPAAQASTLKGEHPGMVQFPGPEGAGVKLAAGWLIEQCGWKGVRRGDAGCYPKQALVLVNYGRATGTEILQLSEDIIGSVREKFGVTLEREVNIF